MQKYREKMTIHTHFVQKYFGGTPLKRTNRQCFQQLYHIGENEFDRTIRIF